MTRPRSASDLLPPGRQCPCLQTQRRPLCSGTSEGNPGIERPGSRRTNAISGRHRGVSRASPLMALLASMWSSSLPLAARHAGVAALRPAVKGAAPRLAALGPVGPPLTAGLRSAGGGQGLRGTRNPAKSRGSFRQSQALHATRLGPPPGITGAAGPWIRRRAADVTARSQSVGMRAALTRSPTPTHLRASSTGALTVQKPCSEAQSWCQRTTSMPGDPD